MKSDTKQDLNPPAPCAGIAIESGACVYKLVDRDSGDSRIEDCESMRMVSLDIFRSAPAPIW